MASTWEKTFKIFPTRFLNKKHVNIYIHIYIYIYIYMYIYKFLYFYIIYIFKLQIIQEKT
jgi:hypothetical protein